MGFLSSVGSCISSACSVISSAVSGAVGALATGLAKLESGLGAVSAIVQVIGLALGIIKPKEDVEELGAKAMQTDKKPEDFDQYSDYIDHLRNDIKLDKEKFENATDTEKLARTAVGTSIVIKGVEESKGFDIPLKAWVAMATMGLEGKSGAEVGAIIDAFKGDFTTLSEYTKGELSVKKDMETSETLVSLYKELEPNVSDKDIEAKVMSMGG